ncbi:hypothetical protein SAMN02745866_01769 [Alteromonadaceae bacterium Bs31]|nr:hypothetical protein SAMN02745866_01769 [Alteromonadaceae bacterium Bs31]
MSLALANSIETLRLKAANREQLGTAVSLVEDAFHIALTSFISPENSAISVDLSGSGKLVFIKKINLGKITLGHHPIVLADRISAQIRQGLLKIACIDREDHVDADLVWFSDEIQAWSRLLNSKKTHAWYWPMVSKKLGMQGASLDAGPALKTIYHRYGTLGHYWLLKSLMAQGQLASFIQELSKTDVLPFVLKDTLAQQAPNKQLSSHSSEDIALFIQGLGSHNCEQLALLLSRMPADDYRIIWLLEIFLATFLPHEKNKRHGLKQLLASIVNELISDTFINDSLTSENADTQYLARANNSEADVDTGQGTYSVAEFEHSQGNKEGAVLVQPEHPKVKQPGNNSDIPQTTQAPDAKAQADLSGVPFSGVRTEYAGIFLLLNLLDSIIGANCTFKNSSLSIHSAVLAWVLMRIGMAQQLVDELGLATYPLTELMAEAVEGSGIEKKWFSWCANNRLAIQTQPLVFRDLLSSVLKIISRYLWQNMSGGIKSLGRQKGELIISNTHLDIILASENMTIETRQLGLDISPGWLPWLAKVVTIHYRGKQVRSWSLV